MAPKHAALVFSAGTVGFVFGNLLSARLSGGRSPRWIVLVAAIAALAGLVSAFLLVASLRPDPVLLNLTMLPFYAGWGIIQPQAIAVAMMPFRHIAGQASSWLGAIQQVGGVVLGAVAVYFGGGQFSLVVMAGCMAAIGTITLLFGSRRSAMA